MASNRLSWERLVRIVRENWLLLFVVAGIVVGFLLLRTPSSAVDSLSEVEAMLRNGQPTLVEFYSNT
jgi:uncharacterized membrane-anchored protein YhcB (DUF1043 family)